MREYKVNEECIVGLPACGYGFESSRLCFLARPSDGEFQFEQDILETLLRERNYELYAALGNIDAGNFAFCTKICSKIITSHFVIVLLNPSAHAEHRDIRIPNPNVHLEYGMALSFHKHVIPMLREGYEMAFNVQPLDTVLYTPENFRQRGEAAIDDAILRYTTKEPPGRPVGAASDIVKFFGFRNMRYSDTTRADAAAVLALGSGHGFNLFDGAGGIVFFGYFHQDDPVEIVVNTRFLLNNIGNLRHRLEGSIDEITGAALTGEQHAAVARILSQISIVLLVPEDAPVDAMERRIREHMNVVGEPPIELVRPSDVADVIAAEYKSIEL